MDALRPSPRAAAAARPAARRRPRPWLGALALALLAAGCGQPGTADPAVATGSDAPRGLYETMTDGEAEDLVRHIEMMSAQFAQINEPSPARARAARLAYNEAMIGTSAALTAKPNLPVSLQERAATTWLTALRERLEADKDRATLDRFLNAADTIIERFPNSRVSTMAAFAKADTLFTVSEQVIPDLNERVDKLTAAGLALGQADPPYPDTPKILGQLGPLAERLGKTDRALAVYRILIEKFPDTPEAQFAPGNAYRLALLGKPVDDFKANTADGQPFDLASLKGKVVLIDFWATWCGPCAAELPELKRLRKELGPDGFELVSVSVDRDLAVLRKFLKEKALDWTQLVVAPPEPPAADPANPDQPPPGPPPGPTPLEDRFGVTFVPLKLLVGRDGTLIATGYGLESIWKTLGEQFPDKPLGKPPEASTAQPPPIQ